MRGVCVDATNKPPAGLRVRNTGLDSVRIEMRDLPEFYSYTTKLGPKVSQAWLVGPSTGPIEPILSKTTVKPDLVIIGNEPDIVGDSSWTMTRDEYVALWNNGLAHSITSQWPNVELATAGMYNPAYLQSVWSRLWPKPDYANRHYPDSQNDILAFDRTGVGRTIVGEWCWRTATEKEMFDWESMLEYYSWSSFWYNWGDWMGPGTMGLRTLSDSPTKAYYYLRKARRRLTA